MRDLTEIRVANGEAPRGDGHPEITTAWGGGSSVKIPSLVETLKKLDFEADRAVHEAFVETGRVDSPRYLFAVRLWLLVADALRAAQRPGS